MKKLITAIAIIAVNCAFAQAQSVDSLAVHFIKTHESRCNVNTVPIKCSNIGAKIDSLSERKINYSHYYFNFLGKTITVDQFIGGSLSASCGKKPSAFTFYKINTVDGQIQIEVLAGNSDK